jgi:transposase InsO family protein
VSAKYAVIDAHRAQYPLRMMCTALGVSRSGFYAWQRPRIVTHIASSRLPEQAVREAVHAAFTKSRQRYGAPRIHRVLRHAGLRVAKKRVARVMQQEGLVARPRRRFVRTTHAGATPPMARNRLDRDFAVGPPNRAWASDITYVPTATGLLYLAVVLDIGTRRIVGWAMRDDLQEALVLDALRMALTQCRAPAHLLHHSDRGSQYTGQAYQQLLAAHQLDVSLSRPGNCWDNAVVESFFATLEHECLARAHLPNRNTARQILFDFLEIWYNRERMHSSLDYQTPEQYTLQQLTA